MTKKKAAILVIIHLYMDFISSAETYSFPLIRRNERNSRSKYVLGGLYLPSEK